MVDRSMHKVSGVHLWRLFDHTILRTQEMPYPTERSIPVAPTQVPSPLPMLSGVKPLEPTIDSSCAAKNPRPGVHVEVDTPEEEVQFLADALASRFEELYLIHGLTQRLTHSLIESERSSVVVQALLSELAPCIDSQTVAINLFGGEAGSEPIFESFGNRLDQEDYKELSRFAKLHATDMTGCKSGTAVVNQLALSDGSSIRVCVVPVKRQRIVLGEMLAVRTASQDEFGTIQADMMQTTSMMLAVHLINQRQYRELEQMFAGTIQSLVSALDAKDPYTSGHSSRVAELAVGLAAKLGYDNERLTTIRMGGILHDIGKIGVDDAILRKPGALSVDEFEQVKKHPVIGFDILKGIGRFREILPAVRHHHESWDGTGYPDGLAEQQIPRDAQILAVADAFDAMSSDRPYRSGMNVEAVLKILAQGSGQQWAPDVVATLMNSPELIERHQRSSQHTKA